jgi:hypothetical protein
MMAKAAKFLSGVIQRNSLGLCIVLAFFFGTSPAWAATFWWNQTGNVSNDFNTSGNWNKTGGTTPVWGDQAFFTNAPSLNQTNIAYLNSGNGGFDVLVVSNRNGVADGINMVLVNGTFLQGDFLRVGTNGIITVNSGSMTWWRGGTLGAGGTIILNSSSFNYGGEVEANFEFAGTLVGNSGTWSGTASGGNDSMRILSGGQLIANSGTFYVNTDDAFDNDGLTISSGGTLQVNSGATFVLNRSANAWINDSNPDNAGTIFLNGGTFTVHYAGAQASDRGIQNTGTILGSGTLAMRVAQSSTGQTIASNGVLNIFQQVAGNQQTFTADGGAFGTFKAVAGGTLKINSNVASGMGGSWIVDNGGTLEIGTGASVDLGAAFMLGANFNGTVKINSGANLTFSSATAGSALLSQNGTFEFLAASGSGNPPSMNMPGVSGLNAFTNNGTFLLTGSAAGSATWNGGGGSSFYGLINAGTIDLRNGGTLILNSGDATVIGFSNTAAGTMFLTNSSQTYFWINRTATGWGGDTAVNAGLIVLSNGVFQTAASGSLDQSRFFRNTGTIQVLGSNGPVTNYFQATLQNAGTILITNQNGVLQLGTASTVKWFTNSAAGTIRLGANGAVGALVATNGASGTQFSNLGIIQGQGTLTLGQNAATGGENANFQNAGFLLATNWGGASAGNLFISVGNAFSNGGFSNTSVGTIHIASNMTLTVNRSQNAWAGSGNSVANLGTITLAGGSLNLASDGLVSNAASFINSGTISGWGTIDSVVITTNGGKVFANATNLLAGVGTLTLRVASTTNNATATLGTIGTNAVLNLLMPGGQNVLINQGTISVSGGSINFDGVTGTITNFFVVAGVGNLGSFGIVNTGAQASVIAQNPIAGLHQLVATVGVTNFALLGANNTGGAATLTLGTTTGGGLVNAGTIALQGGFLTLTNAGGGPATLTNSTGLIFGFGTNDLVVANLATGTILASNGVFGLRFENNLNSGVLSNLNAASSFFLTTNVLVNTGKIFLSGGALRLTGSVVTNQGTMTGPGDSPSALYNDTTGLVIATNGTLHIATNATEFVQNAGTLLIVNSGTLNVGPAVWNNLAGGLITNASGGMITRAAGAGLVTNAGVIANAGTFDLRLYNTGHVTNSGGTFNHTVTNASGGVIISSGGTFSGSTFANLGGTVVATNSAVNILNSVVFNTGTIVGSPTARMIITNMTDNLSNAGTLIVNGVGSGDAAEAFFILRVSGGAGDFTNAPGGMIQGAGYFKTATFTIGDRNFTIRNQGQILATNGMLILQPGDAFAGGGFANLGGTVTVANASALAIQRTDNAWANSGTTPHNEGLILLNGGSLVFYGSGLAVANDRALTNAPTGILRGSGALLASLNNQGTVIATNGNLILDNAASTVQNGTLTIANGATFTVLGSAGSFQNNGQMLLGGGTFVGTNFSSLINTGNITGRGTLTTDRNSGSGGANANQINTGTIIANSGTLYLDPGDSFTGGGFSNAASGFIVVSNGATLTLNRTANAWNNLGVSGNTNPRNLGTIELAGGELLLRSSGGSALGRFVDNLGTITGYGFYTGSLTNFGTLAATNGTLQANGTGAFRQAGTLTVNTTGILALTNITAGTGWSFTNEGSILMRGGELQAGVIANTNLIFG